MPSSLERPPVSWIHWARAAPPIDGAAHGASLKLGRNRLFLLVDASLKLDKRTNIAQRNYCLASFLQSNTPGHRSAVPLVSVQGACP